MKLLPVLGKHFLPFQGIPLRICEGTGGNHNKINQRPNAETANSQQIKHAGAHLTHIETMDTEAAKEKAEKEGDPAGGSQTLLPFLRWKWTVLYYEKKK